MTVVMACVFAAGWIRSMHVWDIFGDDESVMPIFFHSSDNTLFLSRHPLDWEFALRLPAWTTNPFCEVSELIETGSEEWHFRVLGVGYATKPDVQFLMLPYWLIVCPLTLLSAYLLLSKPRQTSTKQTTELPPAAGE